MNDFGINDIDKIINESMNQPTLADSMQETADRRSEARMSIFGDFRVNWPIYLVAIISGIFTATLGVFMGLSPTLITQADGSQVIHFNTDWTHIFLAMVYAVAFVGTTELQLLIGKKKYSEREEGNPSQKYSMLSVMTVAVLGMIGTGVAGGFVIASNIAFLTDFREIPHSAQIWVIVIIPILLAFYGVMYLVYALNSDHAKAVRLTRDAQRRMELDHQTRMANAQLVAQRTLQIEEIKAYWRLVNEGKITAAEANAAIKAGKTLGQLESEKGRDLDGNGNVGTTARLRSPMPIVATKTNCLNCGAPSSGPFCSDACQVEYAQSVINNQGAGVSPNGRNSRKSNF